MNNLINMIEKSKAPSHNLVLTIFLITVGIIQDNYQHWRLHYVAHRLDKRSKILKFLNVSHSIVKSYQYAPTGSFN